MEIKSFNSIESAFLSKLNEGFKTFEQLKENVPFNESTLNSCIETLTTKNVIRYNTTKKEYEYDSPVNGDMVVLDGNIMLPTTIIRKKDKLIVSRGMWYEFPADFDIRRIIWNVQLPNKTKSTLVDLIRESVLKVRKSKIIQLPEYQKLVGIIIPYNDNVMFQINTVGEDNTDISLIFKDSIKVSEEESIEFRGFTVRTEIYTAELIDQLTRDVNERAFHEIKINRIYNFSDFVFSNNEIPYSNNNERIDYIKITGIRNKIELTYFSLFKNGTTKKDDVETFLSADEGLAKIKELFSGYAENLLSSYDFLVESSESAKQS